MQRGTRQATSQAFLNKLSQGWREHGDDVIVAAREKGAVGTPRIIASLLPKNHKHLHEPGTGFADMLERVNRAALVSARMKDVTPARNVHNKHGVDQNDD